MGALRASATAGAADCQPAVSYEVKDCVGYGVYYNVHYCTTEAVQYL
jgi:hypothetical protein